MHWIIIVICLLIIGIIAGIGFRRVNYQRRFSAEGIDDEAIINAYDQINRWPQFKLIRLMILKQLKNHRPQGSLADIGCGPGYLIATMAQSLPYLSITGVDISEKILEKARKNLAEKDLEQRATFRLGDIQKLPFEPSSLDFIITTLSLHHWSNPGAAIEEIHKALKPGGQYLIFDLRRDSPRIAYWILRVAQAVILPAALKKANEPTSSFLAGNTPIEVQSMLASSSFKKFKINPGILWLFAWGQKEESDIP